MVFRKLTGDELIHLEAIKELLAEMRFETLEMLAISKDADNDLFLKAKAQALLDLSILPEIDKNMERYEAEHRDVEGVEIDERRPDTAPGWWGRVRRTLRSG